MSYLTRKTFKTPERQVKVSNEGVRSEMVENREGGHDCTITVPSLTLKSREQFKKYNGSWLKQGDFYIPPTSKEIN